MRTALALFVLCASAFGAVTLIPSTISETMRGSVAAYPRSATVYPKKATITVTGTGAWTATISGTLSTRCNYGAGCIKIASNGVTFDYTASGTGDGTITVTWNGQQGTDVWTAGNYTGSITVTGGSHTDIDLTVVAPLAYATFSYPSGYPPQGRCTNSDALYSFADTCTVENEKPPSEAFSIPAQGGSYVDTEFGHTVRRVSPVNRNISYSTITAINADNSLVLTMDSGAWLYFYGLLTGTATYGPISPGDNAGFLAWDATDPDLIWHRAGSHEIWKYKLSTAADTKAADYGGAYTEISNGGTADITGDNWWVFFAQTESQVCAVNLNGLTTANQSSKTYCASYASLPLGTFTNIDFALISIVDAVSVKRYVVMFGLPAAAVWSVNTGTGVLDWERYLAEEPQRTLPGSSPQNDDDGVCEAGEACITQPHATLGRDANGNVVLFSNWEEIYGNQSFLTTLQLNKGASIFRPVEEGGGMRLLYATSGPSGGHFGCNGVGHCVYSSYKGTTIPYKEISGATNGKPAEITTTTAHGYATSSKVIIDQVTGNTCVNHVWTVTSTGTYTFTLDGSDCTGSGAYGAGTGLSAVGTLALDSPLRMENTVSYLNGASSVVYRINSHRMAQYNTNSNGYYNTPRTSLSRDGAYIAYASNMGTLGDGSEASGGLAVYVAATGLGGAGPPVTGVGISGSVSITGAVVIR